MALSESTLATEFEVLTPTADAAEAAQRLADAYGNYMSAATANGGAILTVTAAVSAMAGAMTFSSSGSAASAAAAISAGVSAFWGVLVAAPATHFAGATVITPPAGLAGLTAALTSMLSGGDRTLEEGAAALASDVHAATAGGSATFPGPLVAPII